MKILLLTRPNDNLVGGDFVQAQKTAEALRLLGAEVEIKDWIVDFSRYDLVHLFVFKTPLTESWIQEIKKLKKPLICSFLYQ